MKNDMISRGEESEFFSVIDDEGNETTFEVLLEFESEETGKRYLITKTWERIENCVKLHCQIKYN